MSGHRCYGLALAIAVVSLAAPAEAQDYEVGRDYAGDAPPAATPPQIQLAPTPPPGSRVDFMSSGGTQWEVLVDAQPACATPCSLWLDPARWVTMRTQERRPIVVQVGRVGIGETMVVAKPLSTGAYATGITFSALGGAALLTGITLGAIGCSYDRDAMCTAGWISGGAGLVVTAGAIWLIQHSMPRLRIGPAAQPGGAAIAARF